jgi:AcrR family transcriptional regulator
MNRPAHSREIVLQAAERIVQTMGAGNLTFDNLVKESGVTRGGITYHFPTKDALLQALLERDLAQWEASEAQFRPKNMQNERAADLIGVLRAMTHSSEDKRRFVGGMMSAATLDPDMLKPIRDYHDQRYGELKGTPRDINCLILELAAAGMFWMDITRCHEFTPVMRKKIIARLENLAKEWSE